MRLRLRLHLRLHISTVHCCLRNAAAASTLNKWLDRSQSQSPNSNQTVLHYMMICAAACFASSPSGGAGPTLDILCRSSRLADRQWRLCCRELVSRSNAKRALREPLFDLPAPQGPHSFARSHFGRPMPYQA